MPFFRADRRGGEQRHRPRSRNQQDIVELALWQQLATYASAHPEGALLGELSPSSESDLELSQVIEPVLASPLEAVTSKTNRRRQLRSLWLAGLCLLLAAASPAAAQKENPLESVDTSSPRATLTSFLEELNEAITLYRNEGDRQGVRERVIEAVRCLDLSEVPPTVVDTVGFETALRLKEVLDRLLSVLNIGPPQNC